MEHLTDERIKFLEKLGYKTYCISTPTNDYDIYFTLEQFKKFKKENPQMLITKK